MNEIKRFIYPPKLEEYIRKNKYIPRKVRDNEHLKLYHRYWLEDYNEVVKVDDIFITRYVEYYSIRYKSSKHYIWRYFFFIRMPTTTHCCFKSFII